MRRSITALAMLLTLLLTLAVPAAASTPQPTAADLAAFIDPVIEQQLSANQSPGAVIVVVKDGQVLYKKGYGYADLEAQSSFDPDRTLFTIGSVTKLFTATAVMQQVEQGQLDLHADVNEYLSAFQVPATFAEPITLHHLLTHTAGFDDQMLGWIAPSIEAVEPLRENLAKYLPPRVRPPGLMSQYNNHGISLAGHLVEEVSGLSFPEYLAEHVWKPLGMTHTTYRPSTSVAPEIGKGYMALTGQLQPGQRTYFNVQPAGGIWTTAADMAPFMIAHLQGGTYQAGQILKPATAALMQQQQFTAHPAISGHGYGFFEHVVGIRRGLQHGGEDAEGFTSQLYLLPAEGAGLFVSFNKLGTQTATAAVIQSFLERYYPVPSAGETPVVGAADSTQRLAGTYTWIRQDRHSLVRPLSFATTYRMQVQSEADGVIRTTTSGLAPFMEETRWIQVEPLLFKEAGGSATLAFGQDEQGRITHLYLGWPQPITMQRNAWYESPGLHLGFLLFGLLLFFPVIGWGIAGLFRRLRRSPVQVSPLLRRARLIGGLLGGLMLLFLLGMPIAFLPTFLASSTISAAVKVLLWLPIITTLLTVPFLALLLPLWRQRVGSLFVRLQLSLMSIGALLFIPFLYYWRWLGFHF